VKRFNRMSALGLALTIGLIACTDSTGPDDAPFSPVGAAADLLVVDGAFDSDMFVSLAESSTIFNSINGGPLPSAALIDGGWNLALADGSWEVERAGQRLAGAVSASSPALNLIPEDRRGKTYERGAEGGYYHDTNDVRTGAPDNGIRFILYKVNPVTRDLGQTEIGWVDVLDESTDLSRVARVIVVSDGVEYINYTVSKSLVDGAFSFAVAGFFGNGTDQVEVDLSLTFVNTDLESTVTVDYLIEIASRGFVMDASMVLVVDHVTGTESSTIEVSFQQGLHTVVVTGGVEMTDLGESGTIEIMADTQLFATVTVDGETITVVGHDGEALSGDHAQAVRRIFHRVERLFDEKFEHFVRPVSWLFDF